MSILYVDDDRANLVAFRAMVGDLYDVVTAKSAEDALALLADLKDVAVLITDQRMPGMSGTELCERVRVSHPDTVRMLVTAYSDLGAAIDAINRGHVSRYLRKPWKPDELLAALKEAAEFNRLTRTVQELQVRIGETERMYALGVLVAGIGHELRNPLGWITTNLTFCKRTLQSLFTEIADAPVQVAERMRRVIDLLREMDSAIADASEGAARVQDIVESINLSARNEQGTASPVELCHVARSVVRLVQGEVLNRGRLKLNLPEATQPGGEGRGLVVLGSATRVGQVLLNLVVNALQALPERSLEENLVEITVYPKEQHACVEVRDNGTGIEKEKLARIFDPFFTTKGQKGTGLGLAISKQIVEEMGGSIMVESAVGKGTRFVVSLPLVDG